MHWMYEYVIDERMEEILVDESHQKRIRSHDHEISKKYSKYQYEMNKTR